MRRATPKDLAWSAFVALLLALSPLTGAKRVVPALVLGTLGGVIVLVARLRRPEDAYAGPAAVAAPDVSVAMLGLAGLGLFAPTLAWLYEEYTESIWRSPHGLFVPFFTILLARHRLRQEPDPHSRASAWGFALLVPACALAVADAGIRSRYLALLGLLLALPGLSLLLLGARRTRRLAFPLALCVFLVPLPPGLADPAGLPTFSAEMARSIVEALGMPAVRDGTQVELANGMIIEVTQNCSGLSFFYIGCALAALCLGVTRSWPRRLALIASPYVLTALGNGLRVAFLLWAAGSTLGVDWKYTTPIHGMIGTVVCLGVIAGVWLVSDRRALREALS